MVHAYGKNGSIMISDPRYADSYAEFNEEMSSLWDHPKKCPHESFSVPSRWASNVRCATCLQRLKEKEEAIDRAVQEAVEE